MPFDALATIELTEEWQVTPITDANHFRFNYLSNTGYSYLVIAQAQQGTNGLELFGTSRFNLRGQGADLAVLEIPRILEADQRRLAVRGLGFSRRVATKSLTLQIEATKLMIINPSGATTKEKTTNFAQSDNANRVMVAANDDRNGGLIFNRGTKALWVGFGVNAEKSSAQKIMPGGQMDIPNGFTGVINGLFDAADATANNTSRAIVIEMVAA
jgi:hypothetical protein